MNRENVLFGIVGLLVGYLIAFHLVVYVNQTQPVVHTAGSTGGEAATLPSNEVKERQRLRSEAEQAAAAARDKKDSFEAQAEAASASLDAEEWTMALEFLTRANQLRPGDHGTLVRLGHANSAMGDYDSAEKWFRAALDKKPDDSDARSELALTYYLRTPKQPDKAISELTRGLELNPSHMATLHNLSLMYIETGRISEAESTLGKIEQVNSSYSQLPRLRSALDEARRKKSGSS